MRDDAIKAPAISGPRALYETHLSVESLDASITFYRDVVGLTLATVFDERTAFMWIDDKQTSMLGLWKSGPAPIWPRMHFAIKVSLADVLAAAAGLREHDAQPLGFRGEAVEEPVVIGWMPAVSLYCRDPDGHSVEFIHVLDEDGDADFGVQPLSKWRSRERPT